jgi:hypothetical protein
MPFDIKPTFSPTFNLTKFPGDSPELVLDVTEGEFIIRNRGNTTAYQVDIFAYERLMDGHEVIMPLNEVAIDYLGAGDSRIIAEPQELAFSGCMTQQELWIEYNDSKGACYRYLLGFTGHGKTYCAYAKISKRSDRYRKIEKRPSVGWRMKNFATTAYFKLIYSLRRKDIGPLR